MSHAGNKRRCSNREPISVLHRGWMVPVVGVLQRDQVTVSTKTSAHPCRIDHSRRRGSDRARSNRPARRSALVLPSLASDLLSACSRPPLGPRFAHRWRRQAAPASRISTSCGPLLSRSVPPSYQHPSSVTLTLVATPHAPCHITFALLSQSISRISFGAQIWDAKGHTNACVEVAPEAQSGVSQTSLGRPSGRDWLPRWLDGLSSSTLSSSSGVRRPRFANRKKTLGATPMADAARPSRGIGGAISAGGRSPGRERHAAPPTLCHAAFELRGGRRSWQRYGGC